MKQNNFEQWRPVKDYEEFYAVSNLGNVKSLNYRRTGREELLKLIKDKDGYLYVGLWKNGVEKLYKVHRLVAEAFIPNPCPEKYDIVNHKDDSYEGRSDNRVENLEWCDIPYNNAYGHRNERIAKAMKGKFINRSDQSKTVYQYTKSYELVGEYPSVMEVRRQTGWSIGNISMCCLGKIKSAYNFIWSYTLL